MVLIYRFQVPKGLEMGGLYLNTEVVLIKREHCIEKPIFFQGTDLRRSYWTGGLNKEVVLLAGFTV